MIPSLIFFVIYVPGYLYVSIQSDIDESDNVTDLTRYKYLYINGEFKNEYFYWEFVRLFEKLLIQTILEVFKTNVNIMALACMACVLIYGLVSYFK